MTSPVLAKVVDVGRWTPAPETIWVDSSVWIEVVCNRGRSPLAKPYSDFIGRALKASCALIFSPINLAEVGKKIESTECALWCMHQPGGPSVPTMLKRFRGVAAERTKTLGEIRVAWKQMFSMASICPTQTLEACVNGALDRLDAGDFLDPADALQVADARRVGISKVLTHDRDFASVADFTVFTALKTLIDEARTATLLLTT